MPHTVVENIAATVEIQSGAVVSKVIHRDEAMNVTVFGFDEGEGLTEHAASRTALIHVLTGRLDLVVEGAAYAARAGFWLRMDTGASHSIVAREPTLMLLVLISS